MTRLPLHGFSPAELKARLEAERRGAPFLLYSDAARAQRIVMLEACGKTRVIVGRGAVDVSLDWDGDVSRVHTELELLGGCWTVVDDGLSRNGTFVNGERIRGRRRLVDLDRIRVGGTTVVYREPQAAAPGTTSIATEPAGARITEAQRRVLIALCRPYADGPFATPATNRQIADELFLTTGTVKMHLRGLSEKFGVGDLAQNAKRARLAELALQSGEITRRDLAGPGRDTTF
jgi:FHA domain-containing protein/regulatory LuxR family protein